jgi:hypothetical protein
LDFNTDTLVLSRREQIPRELTTGTMAMVDLRPLGSPVFHYAVPVEELWINGGEFLSILVWAISCLTACFVHRAIQDGSTYLCGVRQWDDGDDGGP